jgi:hypothetical protein
MQLAHLERVHAANPSLARKLAGLAPAKPTAQAAPLRSSPVAPARPAAKVAPRKPVNVHALSAEVDTLVADIGRAISRVRAEAERKSLKGLDLTRAALKIQLAKNGLTASTAPGSMPAPDGVGQESAAVKRSKPANNPAFVPEPSRDVRLRECNDYYRQELADIDAEIAKADRARLIPTELLGRRRRTNAEWTEASDKILGRDVRDRK